MTAWRITLDDKNLVPYECIALSLICVSAICLKKFESLDLPLLDQVELNKNDASMKTEKYILLFHVKETQIKIATLQ